MFAKPGWKVGRYDRRVGPHYGSDLRPSSNAMKSDWTDDDEDDDDELSWADLRLFCWCVRRAEQVHQFQSVWIERMTKLIAPDLESLFIPGGWMTQLRKETGCWRKSSRTLEVWMASPFGHVSTWPDIHHYDWRVLTARLSSDGLVTLKMNGNRSLFLNPLCATPRIREYC